MLLLRRQTAAWDRRDTKEKDMRAAYPFYIGKPYCSFLYENICASARVRKVQVIFAAGIGEIPAVRGNMKKRGHDYEI